MDFHNTVTSMSDDGSSDDEEFRDDDAAMNGSSKAPQNGADSSDDDDDDEPIATLKKATPTRSSTKKKPVSYKEEDTDDDDDDDDIPLADLVKKKEPKNGNNNQKKRSSSSSPTKKSAKKAAKEPPAKKKKVSTSSSTTTTKTFSADKKFEFASAALYGTECQKGLLIQRLLCRWWYAIEWPKLADQNSKPPPLYEALDGFPGVYICTHSSNAGHLLDTRDRTTAPCFANFAKKQSAELQELLLKALQEQKRQLVEAEGSGTSTEKGIDSLIKWCQKLNPDKADKEATKVLKANQITLD